MSTPFLIEQSLRYAAYWQREAARQHQRVLAEREDPPSETVMFRREARIAWLARIRLRERLRDSAAKDARNNLFFALDLQKSCE